jgi:hypothetical protein
VRPVEMKTNKEEAGAVLKSGFERNRLRKEAVRYSCGRVPSYAKTRFSR